MLLVGAAQAQTAGVVNLQANQTSGTGSMTPVLTWSTNPAAVSCTAGGGWSGTKAASGTQTLPTISATTNYTLTCSWGGNTARLNWDAPSSNTDGSVLSDLTGFKVVYGTSSGTLDRTQLVNDVTARTTVVPSLTAGTWYFAVRALNSRQAESDNSNIAQKAVTDATASGNVTITIATAPAPLPPPSTTTLKTVETIVYDIRGSRLGNVVGSIALGKACGETLTVGSVYYPVTRSDVSFTRKAHSQSVVARCARS
jgi:hypothetical protein